MVRVFELVMSPGSVTERLTFFAAAYSHSDRVHEGGGVDREAEDIEIIEIPLEMALEMVDSGEISDGKTVILLQWARLNTIHG